MIDLDKNLIDSNIICIESPPCSRWILSKVNIRVGDILSLYKFETTIIQYYLKDKLGNRFYYDDDDMKKYFKNLQEYRIKRLEDLEI